MQMATLTTQVCDEIESGTRLWSVTCDHGLTAFLYRAAALPWSLRLSEWDAARMVVARHFAVERCGCTTTLRLRYALATGETTRTENPLP